MEEYSVRTGWAKSPADIDKLAPAFVKAQGMVEGAVKDKKNDHFRSKYADLGAVWDACKAGLQANELAVLQLPCKAPPGSIGLVTTLLHSSGQTVSETFYMPLKDATNPQAAGSALTYARRYALAALMGVCPEDDDGNAAAKAVSVKKEPLPTDWVAVDWIAVAEGWKKEFLQHKSKDARKELFMTVRGSNLPEPEKTSLLTEMSGVLKGMK